MTYAAHIRTKHASTSKTAGVQTGQTRRRRRRRGHTGSPLSGAPHLPAPAPTAP